MLLETSVMSSTVCNPTDMWGRGVGKQGFISRGERQSFGGGVYISTAGFPDAVEV